MIAPELGALRLPGRLDGIDVSSYQGDVDWPRVADAGFVFAGVKVSEGLGACDGRALANVEGARAAGLVVLAYAFARPSQGDAAGQVRRLWECSGPVMPARAVLDIESAPADWSPARVTAFAEDFADAWREYSALEAVVYSDENFLRTRLAQSERLARCSLWVARYRSTSTPWAPTAMQCPPVVPPWTSWALWQYSGDGGYRVPGVAGSCDRNLFAGDEAELRAWLGQPPSAPVEPLIVVHADPASYRGE